MPTTDTLIPIAEDRLLEVCEFPADSSDKVRSALVRAADLMREAFSQTVTDTDRLAITAVALTHAVTLAGVAIPQSGYNPPDFSLGGWLKRDDLQRRLVQLATVLTERMFLADHADHAIFLAEREFLLASEQYDAWVPGMQSGRGLTKIVRVQPAGLQRVFENVESPKTEPTVVTPESVVETYEPESVAAQGVAHVVDGEIAETNQAATVIPEVAEPEGKTIPPKKHPKATGENFNKGLASAAQLLFECGLKRLPTPSERDLEEATTKPGKECKISRNTLKKRDIIRVLSNELEEAAAKNDYSYFTKTQKWFIGGEPKFDGEIIINWDFDFFKKKAKNLKAGCRATQKKNGESQIVAEEVL
ncbi:MAG: hypothetical protein ACRC2T_13390 [Thermoguttaceae bacterium]